MAAEHLRFFPRLWSLAVAYHVNLAQPIHRAGKDKRKRAACVKGKVRDTGLENGKGQPHARRDFKVWRVERRSPKYDGMLGPLQIEK